MNDKKTWTPTALFFVFVMLEKKNDSSHSMASVIKLVLKHIYNLGIVGEKIHTKLRNEITSRKTPWVDCWPYLIIPIIIYINLYGTNFYILSQSRIFPGFDTKGRLPFYYPWIQHLNILIFHYQEKNNLYMLH